MIDFEYHQPASLEETFHLLQEYGEGASLLAGGTALLVDIKRGERRPTHLVSLWSVPQLSGIEQNGGLSIGALSTVTELAQAVRDQPSLSGLREAALLLGGLQIQNMATVGGNICYASPGADLVPPLLVLDATLRVSGPEGERKMPLDGFLTGPDTTALQAGEVLNRIDLLPAPARTGTAFIKIMRRQALDCSIVSAAARVTLGEDGETCQEVRIGLGAVAPTPFRARKAESLLTGQVANPDLLEQVAEQARQETSPISDVRASADYRRMLTETLVERAIRTAIKRAKGESG